MSSPHESDAIAPLRGAPVPWPRAGRSTAATLLACATATLIGVGICVAAVLTPAPLAALGPVIAVSAGAPLLAGYALAPVIASWRSDRDGRRTLAEFRAALDRLPTATHPRER
jgi:hypothetical protein